MDERQVSALWVEVFTWSRVPSWFHEKSLNLLLWKKYSPASWSPSAIFSLPIMRLLLSRSYRHRILVLRFF